MSTDTAVPDMPGTDTPSTEIERRTHTEHPVTVMPLMTPDEMKRTWQIASSLAASRMFKDAYQAEQAFAKILIGRDLGLSPTQALMGIDLVEGAIQLRGVLLGRFLRQHPDYDYKILKNTHDGAIVRFLGFPSDEKFDDEMIRHRGRWWELLGDEEFTPEDADRAGLLKPKSNHEKYPKNMCVWRALSNGAKFHCPEVMGGIPIYVEGEIPQPQATITTGSSSASPAQVQLPEELEALLARAHAIDSMAWRRNEVIGRLPQPDDDKFVPTVDGIVAELTAWLDEHEVVDGEAMPEDEPAGESLEDAEAAAGPVDDRAARWMRDEEWRTAVGILLNRRDSLDEDLARESELANTDAVSQIEDELFVIAEKLEALDVPVGWAPPEDA